MNTHQNKSSFVVATFETVMNVFHPSGRKLLIIFLVFISLTSLLYSINQLHFMKILISFFTYLCGLSVYAMNRRSQVKADIDYLNQPHYADFPVRQPNGSYWETPNGLELETTRLNKHYALRLMLMSIGAVLWVFATIVFV